MTKPFRVYLDHLVAENIHFHSYVTHCKMLPLEDIAFYSGWLDYGSRLTYPHFPEHIMRKSSYMHYIPIHPYVFSPLDMTRRDMDAIFDYYLNLLVPKKAHSTIAPSDWSYTYDYLWWFFRMSHPYMIQNAQGDPSRPAHLEILG